MLRNFFEFYIYPTQLPLSDEERAYILSGQEPVRLPKPSMKRVLGMGRFWGIAAARFLTEPAWQTFSFWIPLHMVSVRGMASS
jgi:MFS transporter, ACS family, hexuronate transporter